MKTFISSKSEKDFLLAVERALEEYKAKTNPKSTL